MSCLWTVGALAQEVDADRPDYHSPTLEGEVGRDPPENQRDGHQDLDEEFQGEALATTQGERRQLASDFGGVAIFGGAPWQGVEAAWGSLRENGQLVELRLGYGDYQDEGRREDAIYNYRLHSLGLQLAGKLFFSEELPFYVGADLSLVHMQAKLSPLSQLAGENNAEAQVFTGDRRDLALALGGQMGFMWLSQGQWYWGMNLFYYSRAYLMYGLAQGGAKEAQSEMQALVERAQLGASIHLLWGWLL